MVFSSLMKIFTVKISSQNCDQPVVFLLPPKDYEKNREWEVKTIGSWRSCESHNQTPIEYSKKRY